MEAWRIMKIPIYSFQVDYSTIYSEYNPLLLFAQKYMFGAGEHCPLRQCYASAIILIEAGKGTLTLNDSQYELEAGALAYISAGTLHAWKSDSNSPMIQRCVYFDWAYMHRPQFQFQRDYFCTDESYNQALVSTSPLIELQEVIHGVNTQLWVSYYNTLTPPPEILGYRNSWDRLKYNGAFQMFLQQYISLASKKGARDPRIARILSIIEQNSEHHYEPQLYQLASELGLKKSRFHALFKAETGFAPNAFMKRIKFQRIFEDLASTSLSITDIASKHGFTSIHYFSKAFRLATGLSPSEYRDNYKTIT